jgi:hypothetical protein
MVCDIPILGQTSSIVVPVSAWRNAETVCYSVNF